MKAVGDIIGKDVITQDGVDMGEVKDLDVDVGSWRVTGVVVKLNRDVLERLHMRRPMLGTQEILVATADVTGVSDRVVLSRSLDVYAKAPADSGGDDPKGSESPPA